MAFNDKFHINPATGAVSKCSAVVGSCPFGSLDHHFRDEQEARRAFERKAQAFMDWNAKSVVPQEQGWITEHVYDPKRPETFKNQLSALDDRSAPIPTGTRMVLENGCVFEKLPYGNFWELKQGEGIMHGVRKGLPLTPYNFMAALENFGGRMEYTEGVNPIKINWRI